MVFSGLFLIYFALVLAVALFWTPGWALLGAVCFLCLAAYLWRAYLKPRGRFTAPRKWFRCESRRKSLPYLAFAILAVLSCVYWLAYYPGGFNLDAYGQWSQAHGVLPYDDWHPITSTLLVQLVTAVCDSFPFYIFTQITLFSVATAMLLSALQDAGVDYRILLLVAAAIGASPAIGLNTTSMTKDAQFTIVLVLLTNCFLKAALSEGAWLETAGHVVMLGILLALTLLIRHNGVLFAAPAVVALLAAYRRQATKVLAALAVALVLVFAVKGPVSQTLQVTPHSNSSGETVGIPMAILANALVNDSEYVPEDVHEFLNEIASDEEWEEHYLVGEWDSCKWVFGGTTVLQGVPLSDVLQYTAETVAACPWASYESVKLNTQIVWEPLLTNPDWVPEEYIAENDMGIVPHANAVFHSICEAAKRISLLPVISTTIWNTGFHLLAIMAVFVLGYRMMKPSYLLLFLPLMAYDFGTMLLLSGPNQRYFYCTAVLYIPIILALLAGGTEKRGEQ